MSKIHIVYATDERYLLPTQVAAGSAVAHASDKSRVVIHILDCGIREEKWLEFKNSMRSNLGNEFGLLRHIVDMSTYAKYKLWHTSRGIYARLDIPNILRDVDWCVYADGDTLFTDDPLKLSEFNDPRKAMWGHADPYQESNKEWHLNRNLPWDDATHVCAGFILMNLDWFRANDASRKCFDLLQKHPDIPYNDQDVLNIVCHGLIGVLPDEWGSFTFKATMATLPGCFHYAGQRPWEVSSADTQLPFNAARRIWFDTMAKVCGLKPFQMPGYTRVRYLYEMIRSYFCVWPRLLLYRLPGLQRHLAAVRDNWWPNAKIKDFLLP